MAEELKVSGTIVHRGPDIIRWDGVLSPEECEHIRKLAEPFLGRSATFTGTSDNRRTSSSAFALSGGKDNFWSDPVMQRLVTRCAMLCGYPRSHVEPIQMVRYQEGEFFVAHMDNYPEGNASLKASGQRDYTFFIYLNEPDPAAEPAQTGGTTYFPKLAFHSPPKRGSAAFWRNVNIANGADDPRLHHSGQPPQNWVKYGLNVWIRHRPWVG